MDRERGYLYFDTLSDMQTIDLNILKITSHDITQRACMYNAETILNQLSSNVVKYIVHVNVKLVGNNIQFTTDQS